MDPSSAHILVLDDDPLMLKLLVLVLHRLGYPEVASSDNAAVTIEQLTQVGARTPDLILLDLNMPGMDGVEFIRRLVELSYGGSVILVSGENDRVMQSVERLVRAHALETLGRLAKPVQPELLEAMLTGWTPRTRHPQPKPPRSYSASALRQAIERGELTNFYQPKVDLATGRVAGVEALVRWQHPDDGLIGPDRFISVAEEHGLIGMLTRRVIGVALAQLRTWRDAGLPLKMAINISMDDLSDLRFPEFLSEQIGASQLSTQDLVLEVTESRLMRDQRAALDTLTRLHLKRFELSIDDFGTGHSSLAQLRDVPFDELKIDRSFVQGATHNDMLQVMCRSSVDLTRRLGMRSVAEGVEDLEDWHFVRDEGVTLAQGYFIGRPMPGDDLAAWIPAWTARVPDLVNS